MLTFGVESDLPNTGADGLDRILVGRIAAPLDSIQFEAGLPASLLRESLQVLQGWAHEADGFDVHYICFYITGNLSTHLGKPCSMKTQGTDAGVPVENFVKFVTRT